MTGNLLHGWRVEEFGHSRDGVALRAFLPAGSGPIAGLLVAAQHGEEAVTALLARRLLERVSGDATRWVVVPVANPDGQAVVWGQSGLGPHAKDERHYIPSIEPYYRSLNELAKLWK